MENVPGEGEGVEGDAGAWSEAVTREAFMEALSAFDATVCALVGLGLLGTAPPARMIAAQNEGVRRVMALAVAAHEVAKVTLEAPPTLQRSALESSAVSAREAWLRADALAPCLVPSRTRGRHPPVMDAASAEALHDWYVRGDPLALDGGATAPASVPSTVREFAEHLLRTGGAPLPASDADVVRWAHGLRETLRALRVEAHPVAVPVTSEPWKHLLDVAQALRNNDRVRGLAALVLFVEAVRRCGFGEGILAALASGPQDVRVPHFTPRAELFIASVDDNDGPRSMVQKALRILGHDVAKLTAPSRSRKHRAKTKSAPAKAVDARSKAKPR